MSYPAAHEGAIGIDRDESWLSLDPDMLSTRDLIREMVDRLSFSNLMGQSPAARRISERCQRPRPGDLVAEVSSRYRQDPDSRLKGMGYLVALRDEWVHTDAEWAEVREEWEHRRPVEHDVAYGREDAEFIAAARTDVPAMADALRAVLDLHARNSKGTCTYCMDTWDWEYPCSTVQRIDAALGTVTP